MISVDRSGSRLQAGKMRLNLRSGQLKMLMIQFSLVLVVFVLFYNRSVLVETCACTRPTPEPNKTAIVRTIRALLRNRREELIEVEDDDDDQRAWTASSEELTTQTEAATTTTTSTTTFTVEPVVNEAEEEVFRDLERKKTSFFNATLNITTIVRYIQPFTQDEYLAGNESFFVARKFVINDFSPRWIHQPTACPADGPFLLIVVPSLDSHRYQRKAIRDTWASPAAYRDTVWPGYTKSWNGTVKVVFFLSNTSDYYDKAVRTEAAVFGDIVRADFSESYHNLSLKMAMVLRWVALFCARARHVLKVDEDTFVNTPLLLRVLRAFSSRHSYFVLGKRHSLNAPPVVRYGKWQVGEDVYPFPSFPRYNYGHSYVISGDAIQSLYHVSRHFHVIPNEDAYVTGVLSKIAKVSRFTSKRFASPPHPMMAKLTYKCPLLNGRAISQTGFKNVTRIYDAWRQIRFNRCSGGWT